MKKLSEFSKNAENPFLNNALEVINKNIVQRTKMTKNTDERAILKAIDESTGEILGHTAFIRQIEVDEEQFAKFYLNGFQAFYDLKPASLRIFGFILKQLKPNRDVFDLSIDDCIADTGYTKQSIYRGLTELLNNEIIARGRFEYQYFINPLVVFNGNRVTFAKTYVKKKKSKGINDPNQMKLDLFAPTEAEF
jgi:hypothetical protein